jgi:hypothetical protein
MLFKTDIHRQYRSLRFCCFIYCQRLRKRCDYCLCTFIVVLTAVRCNRLNAYGKQSKAKSPSFSTSFDTFHPCALCKSKQMLKEYSAYVIDRPVWRSWETPVMESNIGAKYAKHGGGSRECKAHSYILISTHTNSCLEDVLRCLRSWLICSWSLPSWRSMSSASWVNTIQSHCQQVFVHLNL